jgi:hypothetical protein
MRRAAADVAHDPLGRVEGSDGDRRVQDGAVPPSQGWRPHNRERDTGAYRFHGILPRGQRFGGIARWLQLAGP